MDPAAFLLARRLQWHRAEMARTAASETEIATELVRRARVELVLATGDDPAAYERLTATLDELCVALLATPYESAAEAPRVALPNETAALRPELVETIAAALDTLETALARTPAAKRPSAAPALAVTSSARTEKPTEVDRTSVVAVRDAETIEIFVDFIAESTEGLERVDEILLAADQGAPSFEQINALFRVFHTIKGVAGFLGATDVTRIAHVTETLLDGVRAGQRELSGAVLEAVFEASTALRRLLALAREALLHDRPLEAADATGALVAKIEAVVGVALPAGENPVTDVEAATTATTTVTTATTTITTTTTNGIGLEEIEAPKVEAGNGRIRQTVKVDLDRIDSVVEMIGELIIVESMVANTPEVLALASLHVRNYLSQLSKISRDLQNVAMRMRMVPVRGVFQKMARLTRDLARKTGKDVHFEQLGDTTEMDRSMVERIEDPLIHMVRNAIDHAIEPTDERAASGKPRHGTLRLVARHEGGSVVIELSDDGRGLRREAIIKKARERGLLSDASEQLSDEEVYGLIFLPGFSTAERVSELSGRGVGMDVVKRSIEGMRGRIAVRSMPGAGTSFKLILPLTLAIIDGMLVACGNERYIIPSLAIVESLQPRAGMVRRLGADGELINVRGEIMPLLRLSRVFGSKQAVTVPEQGRVVVVEAVGRKLGLLVDDVLTQQQIVIKPLGAGLGDTELLAGAAILSDGRVGLIVNVDRLGGLLGSRRSRIDAREVAA